MAKITEAEYKGEDGGLEPDSDVERWIEEVEAEEETEAWEEKQEAWHPGAAVPSWSVMKWSTVMNDGTRTSAHCAGEPGAVGDVDKSILAKR